jgi:hypothetical protein
MRTVKNLLDLEVILDAPAFWTAPVLWRYPREAVQNAPEDWRSPRPAGFVGSDFASPCCFLEMGAGPRQLAADLLPKGKTHG